LLATSHAYLGFLISSSVISPPLNLPDFLAGYFAAGLV
jgi:hypothetical protein